MIQPDLPGLEARPGAPRRPRSATTILAVLAAAWGLATGAAAQTLEVSPAQPTELDPIEVSLSGTWRNACVPYFRFRDVEAPNVQQLILGFVDDGNGCEDVETPYSIAMTLQPLPPGTTVVEIVEPVPFSTQTLVQTEVQVEPAAGPLDVLAAEPTRPGPSERVTISGTGAWPNSCVPRVAGTAVDAESIEILLLVDPEQNGPCLEAETAFAFSADVGPLPTGDYDVQVLTGSPLAVLPEAIGRRTLRVDGAPETTARLLGGRFEVSVTFTDQQGVEGSARVLLGSLPEPDQLVSSVGDSALFWFFSPDNTELVVKVLDGCSLNDRFWVFASAATDLEFELSVVDTLVGGEPMTYVNPPGRAATAVNDTSAFATCDP